MRLFLLIIFISVFSFGQNINLISKTVSEINHIKNYEIKTIPYSYFMDKNQIAANGIELKGFYKNGKLKKIEHFVGLSAWNIITQYFFSEQGNLIFVLIKKYQTVDENGYIQNPKQVSEKRFYYVDEKLQEAVGILRNNDEDPDYLNEVQALKKDLEEYK